MNTLLKKIPLDLFNIILEYYDDFEYNILFKLKQNLNKYKHIQIWINNYNSIASIQRFKIHNIFKNDSFLYINIRLLKYNININRNNFFYINSLDINTLKNINKFFKFLFLIQGIHTKINVIKLENNILSLKIFLKKYIILQCSLFSKYRLELIKNRISEYDIKNNLYSLQQHEISINNFTEKISLLYDIFKFPNNNYNKIYTLII